ncbi:hypothetical protein FRC04_000956 [Tulasnella sp. 424]|nr:hypothetical protein FRC04_000956 [Tulasnella sp. 424]KAG8977869.1 hypothetical protein FRC05_000397 [Tulasnella sp. 425]
MAITLTSPNDLDDIMLKLEQALQKPTSLLPVYIFIWYLRTTVVLLLFAFLLWVRLTWKCWTTTLEILALPLAVTLRVNIYIVFWTLETCCDILAWCWSVALPLELLPLILGHLRGDKKSLLNCTYVNHLFHDEANRTLWGHLSLRHGPDIKKAYYGLVIFIEPNLPVIDRRSLIKSIEIAGYQWSRDGPPSSDDYNNLISDLPSLKALFIENKASYNMKFRTEYSSRSRPNLETIVMNDNSLELDIGFWAFVQAHKGLKTLRYSAGQAIQKQLERCMEEDAEQRDSSVLFKPGTMPILETVEAPLSVVYHLVPGRPVKSVKIQGPFPTENPERILDSLHRSTAGVRHLDLELSPLHLELLVSRLGLLRDLEKFIIRYLPPHSRGTTVFSDSNGVHVFKPLRLVFPGCSSVPDENETTIHLSQIACPRLTEVAIQGRSKSYVWTRNNGRWIESSEDSKELNDEV